MLTTPNSLPALMGWLIQILVYFIIADVVLSYLLAFGVRVSASNPLVRAIRSVTNPILAPVRRLLPPGKTGGWDLSPLLVCVLLSWLRNFFNLY